MAAEPFCFDLGVSRGCRLGSTAGPFVARRTRNVIQRCGCEQPGRGASLLPVQSTQTRARFSMFLAGEHGVRQRKVSQLLGENAEAHHDARADMACLSSLCQVSVVGRTAFMVAAERALETQRMEDRLLALFSSRPIRVLCHGRPCSEIPLPKTSPEKTALTCPTDWGKRPRNLASMAGLNFTRHRRELRKPLCELW